MKKFLILLIIIALAFFGYKAFKVELSKNLYLNTKISAITDVFSNIGRGASEIIGYIVKPVQNIIKRASSASRSAPSKSTPVEVVTLVMKHGGKMTGKLLKKDNKEYILDVNGEKYVLNASRVNRIEYNTQKGVEWPYKNGVVLKRMNGIVLDGEIIAVGSDTVTLLFTEGGGRAETEIARKDIDRLIFAPVCDTESEKKERLLKSQFPKMKVYKEGNISIITDAYPAAVNSYKNAITSLYTELYLTFFKLFKDRKPQSQCFVVIFDDFQDYIVFAATEGLPGWLVVGFFSPLEKVLYTYNAFGKRMEECVFDVIIGRGCGAFDSIVEFIKKQVDERYHMFLEGRAKEISDKYWTIYGYYKSEMENQTLSTIRHEFAHEVFHSWGLQNIILSKPNIDEKKLAEKRKRILETTSWQEKENLVNDIIRLKRAEGTDFSNIIDEGTAQSWLNEGIATYCGTDPIGSVDDDWLFIFQEAARKNEVNPIEFLTSFKIGSFPGLCQKGILNSYAESWALANFLMAKYPDLFMEYQQLVANKSTRAGQDEMTLLLKTLGKDLPTLEKEFTEYMATYKPAEDPYVKRFMKHYDVWNDLRR